MRIPIRLFGVLAAAVAAALGAVPAQAQEPGDGNGHAVFVQTNSTEGNGIATFRRGDGGTLTYLTTYPTGGLGGRQASAGSDPLASQGSLVLVRDAGLLLAVNGGSNTISVFQVDGDRLSLAQVLPSGGPFPSSLAVSGGLVYVLDAGGDGFVSGYRIAGGRLHPIEDSTRALGLGNAANPFFLSSPAQIGITPDGDHLVVTTKTHNTVDVFSIAADGRPSAAPVKNTEGPVPFAFVFDGGGRVVVNFAGTSSLETFTVNADNTVTPVSAPVSDGRAALCWVVAAAAGYEYASNTASGDVSAFRVDGSGSVSLVSSIAASGIPGVTDSASAGGFLYVQSGSSGTVFAFSIGAGGALTQVQVVAVPDGDDQEGIAVS